MARRLRIPLLTGDGFALGVAMATLFVVPSACVALAAIPLFATGHWIVGTLSFLVGAFFAGAFHGMALDGWRERPSDLVLDGQGLRVVGGPTHGARVAWSDVDGASSAVERDGEFGTAEILWVGRRSGGRLALARTAQAEETLDAVLNLLRAVSGLPPLPKETFEERLARVRGTAREAPKARRKKRRRARPSPEPAPEPEAEATIAILHCRTCGAPVAPIDAPSLPCRSCGEAVELPELLRARFREVAEKTKLSARSERLLRRAVLHQSAGVARAGVLALAVLAIAAWLVSWAAFAFAMMRREILDRHLLYLALPVGVALAASLTAGVFVVPRRAIHLVAFDFAAAPPAAAGEPPRCRTCGAPLASTSADALLVGCAYCRSVNVLGIEIPRAPGKHEAQVASLEDTLVARDAELVFRAIFLAVLGIPGLLASIHFGRAIFAPPPEVRARIACLARGDANACHELALAAPGRDPELLRRSCELGHALGCLELGADHWGGEGPVPLDRRRARELFERACTLGNDEACGIVRDLGAAPQP